MGAFDLSAAEQKAAADEIDAKSPMEAMVRLGVQPVPMPAQPNSRPSFVPLGTPPYRPNTRSSIPGPGFPADRTGAEFRSESVFPAIGALVA